MRDGETEARAPRGLIRVREPASGGSPGRGRPTSRGACRGVTLGQPGAAQTGSSAGARWGTQDTSLFRLCRRQSPSPPAPNLRGRGHRSPGATSVGQRPGRLGPAAKFPSRLLLRSSTQAAPPPRLGSGTRYPSLPVATLRKGIQSLPSQPLPLWDAWAARPEIAGRARPLGSRWEKSQGRRGRAVLIGNRASPGLGPRSHSFLRR